MGWNAASMSIIWVVALARSIIVARLLAPDDYGLFSMAATVVATVGALTNMGFDLSIITRDFRDASELRTHLDTVWTAELGRRLIISLLLLAAVYPTVLFYGEERLYAVLPVLAIIPLIQGFQNIGLVLLQKQVQFKRIVLYEQINNLASTALAVVLALLTRSVWALIMTQVLAAIVSTLLSYVFHPYRPKLSINPKAFRDSLNFGKHIFVIGVMTYVTTTADNVALGRLEGTVTLGAYVLAYGLASVPVGIIMGVVNRVMVPAYAELKTGNREQLERVVGRAFVVSSSLLILLVLPILLFPDEVIEVFYGAKWLEAIPLLRILALVGLSRGLANLLSPLTIGMSKPDLEAKAKTFEALLFVLLLYPLVVWYSAVGAAWAGVAVYSVAFLIRIWIAGRLAPGGIRTIPKVLLKTSLAAACGGVLGIALSAFVTGAVWRLILGSIVSVGATSLLLFRIYPAVREEATALWFSAQDTLGSMAHRASFWNV